MPNPSEQLGNPRLLRVMNERLLLDRLRETGPASRVQLARLTGLSKPTVSAALAGLVDAGLAHAAGQLAGRPGPVTSLYDMNAGAAHVLGMDIGREWIRVAVADLRGQFLARRDGRNSARTAADLVRRARRLADEAVAAAGVERASITCAVVGSPGVFDPSSGRVEFAPNLPDWGRLGLVDQLRQTLDMRIALENDVNLAAVGEHVYGQGKGKDHFVLISIGTGVGMGIIINGRPYTGARGAAGEVSYIPALDGDSMTSEEARWHGATETVVAASGVARAAQASGLRIRTAKEVFTAAAAGDAKALAVVEAEGRRIGTLVVAVAAVLDPEVVVLGGGVGGNLDLLGEQISARIAELSPLRPPVVSSALGESGVLYGAIARAVDEAWRLIFEPRFG
ncbi:MAG TPA: ROK family transcriptional regulator [Micromonosporaceae bacterium]|nr:ROK family transcriptional regulator [Micromonosporaceae bacterium]